MPLQKTVPPPTGLVHAIGVKYQQCGWDAFQARARGYQESCAGLWCWAQSCCEGDGAVSNEAGVSAGAMGARMAGQGLR